MNTAAVESIHIMKEDEILEETEHIRPTTLRYGNYTSVELHYNMATEHSNYDEVIQKLVVGHECTCQQDLVTI